MLTTFHRFLRGDRGAGDRGHILPDSVEGYALSIYMNEVRVSPLCYLLPTDPVTF